MRFSKLHAPPPFRVLAMVTDPKAKTISGFFGCTRMIMSYQHCPTLTQIVGAFRLFQVLPLSVVLKIPSKLPKFALEDFEMPTYSAVGGEGAMAISILPK